MLFSWPLACLPASVWNLTEDSLSARWLVSPLALYFCVAPQSSRLPRAASHACPSRRLSPHPASPGAALSADDRGGFKTVRQLMDPVIEEMREAAAGEDDALLIRAVSPGWLHELAQKGLSPSGMNELGLNEMGLGNVSPSPSLLAAGWHGPAPGGCIGAMRPLPHGCQPNRPPHPSQPPTSPLPPPPAVAFQAL